MTRIDWKKLIEKEPKQGVLLIARCDITNYNGIEEELFTGYWDPEENALQQYKDGNGWKYQFTHWEYASQLLLTKEQLEKGFIEWMCEKAEGFKIIKYPSCIHVRVPFKEHSIDLDNVNYHLDNNVYTKYLLLQQAIEGYNQENRQYRIEQCYNQIAVLDANEYTIEITFEIQKYSNLSKAKEAALIYVYNREYQVRKIRMKLKKEETYKVQDIFDPCPECDGKGYIDWSIVSSPNMHPPEKYEKCSHCNGTGIILKKGVFNET